MLINHIVLFKNIIVNLGYNDDITNDGIRFEAYQNRYNKTHKAPPFVIYEVECVPTELLTGGNLGNHQEILKHTLAAYFYNLSTPLTPQQLKSHKWAFLEKQE